MRHSIRGALVSALLFSATIGAGTAAAQPPAPTLTAPASGASVLEPFTISWSSVTDPTGIVAYNWQVSPSSTFSPVVESQMQGLLPA